MDKVKIQLIVEWESPMKVMGVEVVFEPHQLLSVIYLELLEHNRATHGPTKERERGSERINAKKPSID